MILTLDLLLIKHFWIRLTNRQIMMIIRMRKKLNFGKKNSKQIF